jgi:hypothetical protein
MTATLATHTSENCVQHDTNPLDTIAIDIDDARTSIIKRSLFSRLSAANLHDQRI